MVQMRSKCWVSFSFTNTDQCSTTALSLCWACYKSNNTAVSNSKLQIHNTIWPYPRPILLMIVKTSSGPRAKSSSFSFLIMLQQKSHSSGSKINSNLVFINRCQRCIHLGALSMTAVSILRITASMLRHSLSSPSTNNRKQAEGLYFNLE